MSPVYFSLVKIHSHRLSIESNLTISPGEIGSYRQSIIWLTAHINRFSLVFWLCATSYVGLPLWGCLGLSFSVFFIYVFLYMYLIYLLAPTCP